MRRNERDVDGGDADIKPVFASRSSFSSWSSVAALPWIIDAGRSDAVWEQWAVPRSERRLAITSMTLRQFLETRFGTQAPDVGTPLAERIRAGFEAPGGSGVSHPYRNAEVMLNGQVVAALRQRIPDCHVLATGTGLSSAGRDDEVCRRYEFSMGPGGELDAKLRAVAAVALQAGDRDLDPTWLDAQTGRPALQIVWPLDFFRTG